MTPEDALQIARRRFRTQHLAGASPAGASPARPEDVVGWFGASQAQEYGPAKWAVGQRTGVASDADIEKALADGAILRTHVLRPTWHFVLPADITWMLELTAPRVFAQTASHFKNLGLDETTLERASKVIESELRGGNHLMRKELKAILEKSGIHVEGLRMAFITMFAELRGVVCSGARRGKQQTYALLAERAPNARVLDPDQALEELTHRFFVSRCPATLKDFCWWSSLRVADGRRGLEMVGARLTSKVIGGVNSGPPRERFEIRRLSEPARNRRDLGNPGQDRLTTLERLDLVTGPYRSTLHDANAYPAVVDHGLQQGLAREPLEVRTRWILLDPFEHDPTDREAPSKQIGKRHSLRHEVATHVGRGDVQSALRAPGFEALRREERHLDGWVIGITGIVEVAIASEALAGYRLDLLDLLDRSAPLGPDEDARHSRYQRRSFHSSRCGLSAPIVVSSPWPG